KQAQIGKALLHLLAEIELHQQTRGIRVRRVLQERQIVADIGQPLLWGEELDRQAFQLWHRCQAYGKVERIFAARDTPLIGGNLAAEFQVLGGELLLEIAPELFLQYEEQHAATAERAQIVGQHFALPAGIREVKPALRFVSGIHEQRVGEDAVDDGKHRQADLVGAEFALEMAKARQRPEGLEDMILVDLQRGRGAAVFRDVGSKAPCRVLDADALAYLAGSCFKDVDRYAVRRLEFLLEVLMRGKTDESAVEHHMAFLLGRGDHTVPRLLGARDRRGGQHGRARREPQQSRAAGNQRLLKRITRRHRATPPLADPERASGSRI